MKSLLARLGIRDFKPTLRKRQQIMPLPDCLDDYVTENNPVRVIEAFIDERDLTELGF